MVNKQKVVAFIPIKLNNKRVPGKNTKTFFDGTPLMHLIQKTCLKSQMIDAVYIYCSDDAVKNYIFPEAKFLKRPEGIPGQPVDLLVIDTVSKFIRNNYTPDMKLSELINYLRGLNIAVLLIHHEGSNKEVRGWKSVTDDMYFLVRLFREQLRDEEEKKVSEKDAYAPKTLKEPLTLAFAKARSGIEVEHSFDISFDKVWKVHADVNIDLKEYKNKEFERIVKHYSEQRLIDNDIFPILGISHGTFTNLKKKVGLSKTRK